MPKYTISAPAVLRVTAQGTPRNAHGSIILRVASRRFVEERVVDWTVAPGAWGTPHLTLGNGVPSVVHASVMLAINAAITSLPVNGGVVSR